MLTPRISSLSDDEDAELLVYLAEEEKDIYTGVRPLPARTSPAGLCPAESLSYLGVAESLRTGKWRPHRGLYRTKKDRKKDLDTWQYILTYGELLKGFRAVSRPTESHVGGIPRMATLTS
jgi:hypothetical protein